MVRRLPVIQSQSSEDELAERRPAWQWTLIGTGLAITIWLPLLALALWIAARTGAVTQPATGRLTGASAIGAIAPLVAAFAVACVAAGALVGRFGGRAGAREAAVSGAVAALVACSIAVLGGGSGSPQAVAGAVLVLGCVGSAGAWLGARLGLRTRPRI